MTNEEAIKELESAYSDNVFRGGEYEACRIAINSIQENTKLKAEIKEYKSALTTWNNANNEMLKFNQELKDEIKQLKAELEQSVKLPCKVGDKLFSTENGYVEEFKVRSLNHIVNLVEFSRFDETVFFTREEAEQHLKSEVSE